ncbi:MAG: hypothetical protein L2C94_005530 [Aigarchaeota archaeon]|nr:hypothetical protein [Candidatus Wolframiiraptor gerlachensis]
MIGVYYVDTAIPSDRKKRGRVRLIRSSTGGKVFKVRRLTELEAPTRYTSIRCSRSYMTRS